MCKRRTLSPQQFLFCGQERVCRTQNYGCAAIGGMFVVGSRGVSRISNNPFKSQEHEHFPTIIIDVVYCSNAN